ncbi:MAG TPA: ABC transporter permease [Acidobacteriota bacterium]|nr:ABC transporter permease [Acidobacteriota bacterium]
MDALRQDIRFAVRQLWKDKGFLFTAGLTLALCIGANTTIFSVVNSVILEPLDVPQPERLVTMSNVYPGAMPSSGNSRLRGSNSVPDYFDRRALDAFEEVAVYRYEGRSIEIEGTPQRVTAQVVTPSLFTVLGAEAALGRTLSEAEGEYGQNNVVVLSHGLWEQLYAGNPSVIGSEMQIDATPFTIVGIMSAGFAFLDPEVRLWTAFAAAPERLQDYHNNSWTMIARLANGTSLEQAQQQVDALNTANMEQMPAIKPLLLDAGFHTPLYALQEDLTHDVRGVLYMLWGGVAFVLLIGCVNVANLLLVRSTARSKELATRFALGARVGRVVQQLLTEIAVLSVTGAAAGLLLGQAGLRALSAMGIDQLPRAGEIQLDTTAVLFTLMLASAVGALVAVIPLAGLVRLDLSAVFREEGRSGTASRGLRHVRRGMVVTQVAFALMLLVAAGLLMASFRQLLNVNTGFDPQGVLTGSVSLTPTGYPEYSDLRAFAAEALPAIASLPGVESVGFTSQIPFGNGGSDSVIFAEGYVMEPGESAISPQRTVVTPDYFATLDIRVTQGRAFDSRDTVDGLQTIIIDERLASRFWGPGEALGKRMWRPESVEDIMNSENAQFFEVVGIVEPVQMGRLELGFSEAGAYYFPYEQSPVSGLDLAIRTSGDPRSHSDTVRRTIATIDPDLPLFDIRTLQERVDASMTTRRTPIMLAAGFSGVALLLAAVGIYGILAYLVQLRTKEFGIRSALGGNARSIFSLVLREGTAIVALGLTLGLGGAMALRRAIESQLFGVSPMEPAVVATVSGVLATVALIACLIPARRATRIDPVAALAEE